MEILFNDNISPFNYWNSAGKEEIFCIMIINATVKPWCCVYPIKYSMITIINIAEKSQLSPTNYFDILNYITYIMIYMDFSAWKLEWANNWEKIAGPFGFSKDNQWCWKKNISVYQSRNLSPRFSHILLMT